MSIGVNACKRMRKLFVWTVAVTMLCSSVTVSASISSSKSNIVSSIGKKTETVMIPVEDSDNERWIRETYESVVNGQTCELTNAAQVSRFVQTCYSNVQKNGPFSITKGTLRYNQFGIEKPVYVVAISGTDTSVKNQTTGNITNLLVGFEQDNLYIQNVKKTILRNIPKGSKIVFAGHSLGGMISQQAAADEELKSTYEILNTITFGSPLIDGFDREGTVRRLGDVKDHIPYMSISTVLNIFWQSLGINKEDGGYQDWIPAHTLSYQREDVWGQYDVTGQKYGKKSLVLDYSTTSYFHSPIFG